MSDCVWLLRSNLDQILDLLRQLGGYHCVANKLRANNYGLPQRRTRYFIIGLQDCFSIAAPQLLVLISERLEGLQLDVQPLDAFL